MTLTAGTRLGTYEILSPLGAGGMGEVWKARDTRLGREVAVKVLAGDFLESEERKARFEREARTLAALNHPNIAAIYAFEEIPGSPGSPGRHLLVQELLEGETLRDKLSGGALPVRKVLEYAAQIAHGLAAAHGKGIVHRDLKPENVFLTRDGQVKLLDFGLAKTRERGDASDTQAPTLAPATAPGIVMGTMTYMSPEQARGEPVDFRSDQFALGSVLYEMLTGRRTFERKSAAETMAAIIREEPQPIASLAPGTPAPLRWIVERCLSKEPRERYAATEDLARDIAKAREHLSEYTGEAALSSGIRPRRRLLVALATAAGCLLVGLAAGFLVRGRTVPPQATRPLVCLNMTFPSEESIERGESPVFALSPDGSRLVYSGRGPQERRLYVRPLDRLEPTPVPGTDGGIAPFFSPDGQWVGFWADRKLKKVSLAGGQPLILCDAEMPRGASWGTDGTILFSRSGNSGLFAVADRGGEAKAVTKLDQEKGEATHRWPRILPGGKAAIYTANSLSGNFDNARICLLSLATGETRTLLEGGTDARYVPTGHLIYLRSGSLFMVPFDLKRLAVTGDPIPVLNGVDFFGPAGFALYDVSPDGTLVYRPLDPKELDTELVWVNRKGEATPLSNVRRAYGGPRFSPDGRRLAVGAGYPDSNIWILDLKRGSWDRLISGGINGNPVWVGGGSLAFASNRSGPINTFWMPADRSSPPEQLTQGVAWSFPYSSSPDGQTLIIEVSSPATGWDISALSLTGDHELRPFLESPANEIDARFSPDGRWVAYQSDESGRPEIYVTAFPSPGARAQVSIDGGSAPVWSRDGREIFFAGNGKMMAAPVETRPEFRAGLPRPLFDLGNLDQDYDVAPDGQRFVMIRGRAQGATSSTLAVVSGWFDELKRRAPQEKR
jgi:Tol biopolymer transport system component